MNKRPHIVIFNPDQWRGDVLGHVGNPAAVTPHLDRMVRTDGVSFRNAFCQNTVCTPSRCSFMTGWYPHVRGHRTMFHMLQPDEPMLLKTLKDNGYDGPNKPEDLIGELKTAAIKRHRQHVGNIHRVYGKDIGLVSKRSTNKSEPLKN